MTLRSESSAPVIGAKSKLKPQGLRFSVAPKLPINYGMDAARNLIPLIPKCWFDQDKCRHGIEALRQYRAEYDERLRALRPTPLHDWTSHAADAFRYGAIKGAQQIALGLAD
jgi:phage terminase large subunit